MFFTCPRVKEIWTHLGMTEIIDEDCFVEVDGIGPLERLLLDTNDVPALAGVRRCDLVAVVS